MCDPISEDTLKRLTEFIGYGPRNPSIVFLGIEEAGGDPENLAIRASFFRPVEDLCEADETLKAELQRRGRDFSSPFRRKGNPVQQWNTASRFALALANADPSLWQRFWRQCLGRKTHETFLMECYPLARKSTAHYVSGYDPQVVWTEQRRDILRRFLNGVCPRVRYVIAYGKSTHQRVAALFGVQSWNGIPGTRWDIGVSKEGTVICRVGFFGRGYFHQDDINPVVSEMWRLGGGPVSLTLPT